jgi:hypothetical protein
MVGWYKLCSNSLGTLFPPYDNLHSDNH